MNELNYATLPASKRLVEAGIVLNDTDAVWVLISENESGLSTQLQAWSYHRHTAKIPAPCMAEVWRELPEQYGDEYLQVFKDENETRCGYGQYADRWHNTNPTDALIDLLIWVRQKGKEGSHDNFKDKKETCRDLRYRVDR